MSFLISYLWMVVVVALLFLSFGSLLGFFLESSNLPMKKRLKIIVWVVAVSVLGISAVLTTLINLGVQT